MPGTELDDADRTAAGSQQLWFGGTIPRPDRPASIEAILGFQAPLPTGPVHDEDVARPRTVARPDEPKFWQLHKRYIFAQTGSGVIVIDQHAAHERILYERAMARLEGMPASTQQLLIPENLELTPSEEELLDELLPELGKLGFEIEPFGPRSVLVRAIPDDIHIWDRGQLLRDVLDEYVHAGRSVRAVRERLARSFACRAAVKSGHALAPSEMRALIDALFATDTPHGDPHGRATLIQMSLDELDHRFGRA
jgi:DNA mismatch repair protein MutL